MAIDLFRRVNDQTVAGLRRVLHRVFRPRPHRLHTIVEFLNLWHRDTFIHHGSAIFITSEFVTRVCCLKELPSAHQRGFFEATADCDELRTWHDL